jgi:hypothetical protein
MRDWRGLIAVVATAALVAGCQREHLVQPGTGPTAQAAPPHHRSLTRTSPRFPRQGTFHSPVPLPPNSDIRE